MILTKKQQNEIAETARKIDLDEQDLTVISKALHCYYKELLLGRIHESSIYAVPLNSIAPVQSKINLMMDAFETPLTADLDASIHEPQHKTD